MARGKQTFNKSEREKKKRKERKDKEERREDRKSNNNKGKSFEEMLAYVDEYGRLSSTPPDPTKRVSINAEDIQVSTSRQPDVELQDGERSGVVSFFNESKGYGFIKDLTTQESFFVHITEVAQVPREGDKVTFKAEERERGLTAVDVKPMV
jgi:cold shock CspA family protein